MANERAPTLGVDVTATSTTNEFGLGTEINIKTGRFVYVQASAAIAAKTAVKIVGLGTWQAAESGNAGKIDGVANVAIASGSYGWVQTQGYVANAVVATTVADDDPLSLLTDASGDFVTAVIGTNEVRGKALEADTAGIGDIYLY